MPFTKRLPFYAVVAYLLYLPFHVFLAQSLSLATGGLDIWKIAKDVLLALLTLFVVCSVVIGRRVTRLFVTLMTISFIYALFHAILWAVHPDIFKDSALIGLVYNIRLPAFLMLGYGASLLRPDLLKPQFFVRLVIIVGTLVALLGVLQYFLPKDILTHAGYSIERGVRPAFFIDDKAGFPRVMSTLREPNALGGFLLVPMGLATALLIRTKNQHKRIMLVGILGIQSLALFFTFSRSAWAAALLVLGLIVCWYYRQIVWTTLKRFWLIGTAAVLLLGIGLYTQRNSPIVTSYITHASSDADLDSNDYHRIFLQQGLEGIADQPMGHGPGTAGLASIQDPKGSFLTENYYVQIAYEVGILGLLAFVALNVVVYIRLWPYRNTVLGSVLLATFWGYVLMNMVLHTWSNEAIAGQWWLLAGLALGALNLQQDTAK
jgi:hypothetical protein